MEVELNVGNNSNGPSVHLSDDNAAHLLDAGLSFVEGNHVTVDAHSTHLKNSLKDLEKLNVDAVTLTTPNSHEVLVDLHDIGDASDLFSVLNSSIPNFSHASDVTVALDLMNDPDNQEVLRTLAGNSPAKLQQIQDLLQSHGINDLLSNSSIDFTGNADWLGLGYIDSINEHSGIDFQIGINGDNRVDSLDAQLSKDAALRSALGETFGDNNFGGLIDALKGNGVNGLVIESGKVEISDDLTSALVESGMLHALPGADIIIDASHEAVATNLSGESYIHLSTNLNTMAQLGVDEIDAGSASKVYLDIQDLLGLPTGDQTAMDEIRALLNSLDPANGAKLVTGENAPSISLVMSTNLLDAIAQSGDHFSADDLSHMAKLGITDIAIRDDSVDHADAAALKDADTILMGTSAEAGQPAPVEVKIIGQADDMHDVLDPTKLHLPTK